MSRPARTPTASEIESIAAAMGALDDDPPPKGTVGYISALMEIMEVSKRTAIRYKFKAVEALDARDEGPWADLGRVISRAEGRKLGRAEAFSDSQIHSPNKDLSTKDRLHHSRWVQKTHAAEEYGDRLEIAGKLEAVAEESFQKVITRALPDLREALSPDAYHAALRVLLGHCAEEGAVGDGREERAH